MNGPQDLGGQHGHGPVAPEVDEPLFHAPWERRALALSIASGALGRWTIDEARHARESLAPADYLSSSYYEIWTKGLEALLQRHGLVTADELADGRVRQTPPPQRVLTADAVPAAMARGGPADRDPGGSQPVFAPGDRVRTVLINPSGHTRLPRYARGREGVVEAVQGFHVFPDTNAHGQGEQPQWLYTVVFDATALWGRDADPQHTVSVDAWESYLDAC